MSNEKIFDLGSDLMNAVYEQALYDFTYGWVKSAVGTGGVNTYCLLAGQGFFDVNDSASMVELLSAVIPDFEEVPADYDSTIRKCVNDRCRSIVLAGGDITPEELQEQEDSCPFGIDVLYEVEWQQAFDELVVEFADELECEWEKELALQGDWTVGIPVASFCPMKSGLGF